MNNITSFYWNQNKTHIMDVLQYTIDDYGMDIELTDVTYQNDTCASIELKTSNNTYILFLPNSFRNDGEETTKFMLIYSEDYGQIEDYLQFDSLVEVCDLLMCKHEDDLMK